MIAKYTCLLNQRFFLDKLLVVELPKVDPYKGAILCEDSLMEDTVLICIYAFIWSRSFQG